MTTIKEEGDYIASVTSAELIEPRFEEVPPGSFEVHLAVQTEAGEKGDVYLEMSTRYGKGNLANKTQAQITMDALAAIGWDGGMDFSAIDKIIGTEVAVKAKKNTRGYMTVYLSAYTAKPIGKAEAARRAQMMFGGGGQAQPQASNPFKPGGGQPPNPFS